MNQVLTEQLRQHLHLLHQAVSSAQAVLPGALRGNAEAIGALTNLEVRLAATAHTLAVTWGELCSCTPRVACPIHAHAAVAR